MNDATAHCEGGAEGAPGTRLATVWQEFCGRLTEAGEILLRTDAPTTPLDQAEGLRYLSRLDSFLKPCLPNVVERPPHHA